jgi:hypothetical protein
MLIISSGMQKSGSAYFYNVINELLIASGSGTDARQLKNNRNLDDLMKWHNNNIGKLTLAKLIKLWRICSQEGTYVVKTHSGPNLSVKILSRLGLLRIVYCYRDPRDVLLSAVEHGKKILGEGGNHTFANMVDFDKALNEVKCWLRIWKAYAEMPGVLTVKYEEMMQDPVTVTKKIEDWLDISVDSEKRQDILWKFSKDNSEGDRKGMHFNKARTFRYKTEMTEEQKAACKDEFRGYLGAMGYDSE